MGSITNLMALAALAAISNLPEVVFAAHATQEDDDTWGEGEERPAQCHGIALSDASDFGPYQAGALIGLLNHQKLTGERYHVVTGVALGALNAYILATHKSDEVDDTIAYLSKYHPMMFYLSFLDLQRISGWTCPSRSSTFRGAVALSTAFSSRRASTTKDQLLSLSSACLAREKFTLT